MLELVMQESLWVYVREAIAIRKTGPKNIYKIYFQLGPKSDCSTGSTVVAVAQSELLLWLPWWWSTVQVPPLAWHF